MWLDSNYESKYESKYPSIDISLLNSVNLYGTESLLKELETANTPPKQTDDPEKIWYEERRNEYLKNNSSLEERYFLEYFDKNKIKDIPYAWQAWGVANCFFVAALISIMESENYEALIRTSVSWFQIEDGYSFKKATVRLPLWNKNNTKEITIDWDDIKKDANGISSIKWPLWMKILEAAYLQLMWEKTSDRAKFDRARAWNNIDSRSRNWTITLEKLLWTSQTDQKYFSIPNNKSYLEDYLNNFSPAKDYGILGSKSMEWKNDQNTYETASKKELKYSHMYTIISSDSANKTVKIVDPRQISKPFELTYDEVFNNFGEVTSATVDYKNGFKYDKYL